MVMTHFYQQNVFESCLKISARLRAEILQIRVKTGHFGVKMGITISSSGAGPARERCVVPGVFAEATQLRRKYAVMKDAARARPATRGGTRANTHSTLHNPKKGAA